MTGTTIQPKKSSQDAIKEGKQTPGNPIPTHVYEPTVGHNDFASVKDKSSGDSPNNKSKIDDHNLDSKN